MAWAPAVDEVEAEAGPTAKPTMQAAAAIPAASRFAGFLVLSC
ncbi:hypothetical protein GCM10023220_20960 [Streptomyces ziwulingensis]|uniref:Uncharacterized protein n=1 Tax=Streptomyces ziwulingensis TaxID=1045501 RepID=A0ABP9BEW9_9ACTN